jgi:hypothetical protein
MFDFYVLGMQTSFSCMDTLIILIIDCMHYYTLWIASTYININLLDIHTFMRDGSYGNVLKEEFNRIF